jgi:hypothetical protein
MISLYEYIQGEISKYLFNLADYKIEKKNYKNT